MTCIKRVCWSYLKQAQTFDDGGEISFTCAAIFEFLLFTCSSFKLHSTHNIFCFATTMGFLELYIKKKSVFFIFVAKTRWNQLYSIKSIFWFVCRKIVSLPALLHLKKFFLQFPASHPGFLLHFTQKNVFTCVWLSDAVLESSF